MRTISKQQAARFLLLHHGLIGPYRYTGKEGALAFIRSVGSIQYDPVDVCGRNAELVLQARVKGFRKEMLQELLYQDRKLIDFWDKCMAIFPVEDWPYFARKRNAPIYNVESLGPTLDGVRQTIRENGPCCSEDIPNGKTKIRWPWGTAPAGRAALEALFFQGELIIYKKQGTRKYYDLASRHVPKGLLTANDPNETLEAYHQWMVARRIGAVGLLWNRASDAYLEIQELDASARTAAIESLCAEGMLIPVQVEGIRWPFYFHAQELPMLETACSERRLMPRCELLPPLDNLLWDRRLVEAIFGFSYHWEIYTPREKRQYGPYVLPILYGEGFVGRVEVVCARMEKRIEIKRIWAEPGKRFSHRALEKTLLRFARFHGYDDFSMQMEI